MRRIKLEDTLRVDSQTKKLWDLTWGLVLVAALTIVSECGLRLGYSKTPPDAAAFRWSCRPLAPLVK